ncbi:hypothetical protein B7494_g2891 [Chlorociboria aeruginascens]|nr:hypothetical protein B7494_g2891 [Chlorociboria aeruginascens]
MSAYWAGREWAHSPKFEHLEQPSEAAMDDSEMDAALEAIALIKRDSPQRVALLFSKWERLRAVYGKHKDTLKRRWEKKSIEKRKRILNEAWTVTTDTGDKSSMPLHHRPEFNAYKRGLRGEAYKWTYLLPFLNLEDLSDKVNLMLLLDSRAKYEPNVFAWVDSSRIPMAQEFGISRLQTFQHYMLLTGESKMTYGSIFQFGNDSETYDEGWTSVDDGRSFLLGEGFLCLEIQSKILKFLVGICELLLFDVNLENIRHDDADVFESLSLCQLNDSATTEEWCSMMETHTRAQYQVPQQFDIPYLRRLATAKRDETYDEIWALREDPSFFREKLEDKYSFNRNCHIAAFSLAQMSQNRPRSFDQEAFQDAYQKLVFQFYSSANDWNMLLEDLNLIERLRSRYGADISPTKPLPSDYNEALYILWMTLSRAMDDTLVALTVRLAMSIPLRRYYELEIGSTGLTARPKKAKSEKLPPIVALLHDLSDEDQQREFGSLDTLHEIERIMKTNKVQAALIDAPIARLLSELAALGEIDDQIIEHQPRIQCVKKNDALEKCWVKRFETNHIILASLEQPQDWARLCQPLTGFEYPTNRKPNEDNVNQLRAAEAKLDKFWQNVDQHFVRHTGKTLHGLMGKGIDNRTIFRTDPWQPLAVRSEAMKSTTLNCGIESPPGSSRMGQGAQETFTPPPLPMPKQKTRGEAYPSTETRPEKREVEIAPPVRIFTLPKRAFKVAIALFPSDRSDRVPGKIMWADFLHTMSKLEFSIRKVDGSAWYFEPTWAKDLPITFHQPHPTDEIPFAQLRFHGNRLARRYGWTNESFVLA